MKIHYSTSPAATERPTLSMAEVDELVIRDGWQALLPTRLSLDLLCMFSRGLIDQACLADTYEPSFPEVPAARRMTYALMQGVCPKGERDEIGQTQWTEAMQEAFDIVKCACAIELADRLVFPPWQRDDSELIMQLRDVVDRVSPAVFDAIHTRSPVMPTSEPLATDPTPPTRRVIFLDFDGVLHPLSAIRGAKPPLTAEQLRLSFPKAMMFEHHLARLIADHPDVGIVVSSSWRMYASDAELGSYLPALANRYRGSIGFPFRGRDFAIRTWVDDHPELEHFAVLDDQHSFFTGHWPTLFICDSEQGFGALSVQLQLSNWLSDTANRASHPVTQP